MERKLSMWQRIDLRTHLIVCRFCRRFQADVQVLRQLAIGVLGASVKKHDAAGEVKLSVEAKTRIRDAIRQQSG